MKKTNYLLLLALAICMSSCVYSLFPIYTKDSLVYLKGLEGQWKNKEGDLINVIPLDANLTITVEPGEDEFIVVEGDTIRDTEKVAAYWQKELQKEVEPELAAFTEKGHLFQIIENNDTLSFKSKIAKIGSEHFIDMYPAEEYDDEYMSHNLFPVHTFLKLQLDNNNLSLTQFDLDKLKDLFDSNRIRLRHEKVNGAIMITAQPEEIQKFLISYSKDETVFEKPDYYVRVGS
ncbi:hypothetical protein [Marinoscillum pacificum]|uniref:hypothetical protein n=1 Tax=Marinoscillum pacificum TaxID=392723 RepID=UPI00215798B0|nr:hypothetical protein [Marinoscillum pacificum]